MSNTNDEMKPEDKWRQMTAGSPIVSLDLEGAVKIRVEGLPQDVSQVAAIIETILNVTEKSTPHKNHRRDTDHVRQYLTING